MKLNKMKLTQLNKQIITIGFFLLTFSIAAHGDDKPSMHPDHFYCEKNSSNVKGEGDLYILAERNNAKAVEVKYQLPIKEN